MPIYEYECGQCGHQFELTVSLMNPPEPPIRCPKPYPRTRCVNVFTGEAKPDDPCNGECKRLISPTTFVLKGDGWAKDGYSK
jgi:putative FmdB family regulatory protein